MRGGQSRRLGLGGGRLGGAGLDPGADATQSLGVECVFSFLDAARTDRPGMCQRPAVRQEIEQIR